jgi:hypothetical protein
MRASGAITLIAAMVLVAACPSRSFADCKYPEVFKALGAEPNPNGAKIVLLAAGTTSKEFLTATAGALDDLRRSETGLIRSVALETSEDDVSVESKFAKDQSAYNAFVVLDSEFVSGTHPKYNGALDFYRNKKLKHPVMIIDRYLTADKSAAFVQVTADRGAEQAALMIEVAAAIVAHRGLASSGDFLSYGALVSDYASMSPDNPRRPNADEVTKSRNEIVTKCLAVSG